jgi:hypothetical protein
MHTCNSKIVTINQSFEKSKVTLPIKTKIRASNLLFTISFLTLFSLFTREKHDLSIQGDPLALKVLDQNTAEWD